MSGPQGGLVDVVIALGSNLGDREGTLAFALRSIDAVEGVSVLRASRAFESVALKLSGADPDAPRYRNAVAIVRTGLEPHALLDELQRIEAEHGRQRRERWGDRTLDLDLIAYGDLRLDDERLVVPHPRAAERDFVLAPWLDADPGAVLPGRGPVRELLEALPDAPTRAQPLGEPLAVERQPAGGRRP